MDGIIETVKVKRECPRGYKIINKADYDPERHELYDDETVTADAPATMDVSRAADAPRRGRKPKGGDS